MNNQFLQNLDGLSNLSSSQVRKRFGGKALGLYEAKQAGIPIPATWFISADYFEEFSLPLPSDVKNFQEAAVKYLSSTFPNVHDPLPDCLFAVRSSSRNEDSAESSFAGVFESVLHVPKGAIFSAIAAVWDSCHSLRATSYLKQNARIGMGVIIQPMVEAKYAGVCFSKHPSPATVFENHHIVIEYAATSGEKVVQGEVTPTRFSGTTESISSATDMPWIENLLKAVVSLKNYHRHEVDLEFVVDKSGTFILVQQRPVSRTHASHILDLSHYQRKYKRSLSSLDIELLIDGCARFLAPYLELPYRLERWMVMITNTDGQQELWVHKLLDEIVATKLSQRFEEEHAFLENIEARYRHNLRIVKQTDYATFFDPKQPLEQRFSDWCEFLTPLAAHYYVPMFMIDALHRALLHECKAIDPDHAEDDLFFLGTFEVSSLMDVLNEELRKIKNAPPDVLHEKLSFLADRYGFLHCHQVYEEGYSPNELLLLMKEVSAKEKSSERDRRKWESLRQKYIATPYAHLLLEKFREWLKIRNCEMEYYMYAILHSRPLFQEMADFLGMTVKEIWDGSKEMISKAIQKRSSLFVKQVPKQNLVIYHSYGKTRLTDGVKPVFAEKIKRDLHGKKVYGEGKVEAIVQIAYTPQELESLKGTDAPRVLVTGMTTPDFIPHLKKHFLALITDEGGILCHAAIVAREIAIPCIVGTGTATEVLKSGMRVLINLDTGDIEIVA